MNAIKITNLNKKYRNKHVLKDINMTIEDGSFHLLAGKNGAGKTTIIKSMIGAYSIDGGSIEIYEKDHLDVESKGYVSYIPERASFDKGLTSFKYLSNMVYLSTDLSWKESKRKSDELINEFGLSDFRDINASNLSSGQQKKLLLAQAVVNEPKLLIMDEPGANLDHDARIEFWNYIKDLNTKGMTIVLATHILAEVQGLVDSMTIIKDGDCVFNGKTEGDIFDTYHQYTREVSND